MKVVNLTGDPLIAHNSVDAVDIGNGWRLHRDSFICPAITHADYGFHLIPGYPTYSITGSLLAQGKVVEAAKHFANVKSKRG